MIKRWPDWQFSGVVCLRCIAAMAGIVLIVAAAGCRNSSNAGADKHVNLLIWSEYIDPALIDEFEKQTGMKVQISTYEATEDMAAKLQQGGGDAQYDVVVMSDHIVPVMARNNLLAPLDFDRISNRANVTDRFNKPPYDPEGKYTLPYMWGTMGIMYRKDKLGEIEPTWGALFDPAKIPGTFSLINSMPDLFAAALLYQGHRVNSHDAGEVRAAGDIMARAKSHPKFKGFEGSVEGKNKVVSGEEMLAIVYNGEALRGMSAEPGTAFVIPREGSIIWVDAMAIPAKAPNPHGAHQFINFILDAQNGAKLANFTQFASPNKAALGLINEADRKNPSIYPPDDMVAKMQFLEDVGDATRLYDEVWTSVKTR